MLRLPPADSTVRELIDMQFLADLGDSENVRKLPTFRQCITNARNTIARERGVRSVVSFTLRADGSLWLVKVGPRAWKCLWNFGKLC